MRAFAHKRCQKMRQMRHLGNMRQISALSVERTRAATALALSVFPAVFNLMADVQMSSFVQQCHT